MIGSNHNEKRHPTVVKVLITHHTPGRSQITQEMIIKNVMILHSQKI